MTNQNRKRTRTKTPSRLLWGRFAGRRARADKRESGAANPEPRGRDVTRPQPRTSAAYLAVLLLVVIAVSGAFVYHLHVRFNGVWLGYETSRARAERARLLVERRELRLELASLKSPARVESEAREKLGMEMPDHTRIIPIGKKRTPILASGRAR